MTYKIWMTVSTRAKGQFWMTGSRRCPWLATLLFSTAFFLPGGAAHAQIQLNFDTAGPTSTAELPDFFDVFGFDADFGSGPLWHVEPNTSNPANNSNALHTISDGNQLEAWFSRVAILKGSVFFGENVELSADITWDDAGGDANDNAGLYVRFNGSSDVPLENDYYFVRAVGSGSPDLRIHKVKNGVQEQLIQRTDHPISVTEGDTHNLRVMAETVGNAVEISVWLDDQAVAGMDPFVDMMDPILGPGRVGVGQETNPSYFDNILISGPDIDRLLGDFNDDASIDLLDFEIMLSNFNTSGTFEQGDNNFDSRIDLQDFADFRIIFNSPGAAVPEPTTWILSLAGMIFVLICRR